MERGDCDEELNTLLGEISSVTTVSVSSPGESSGDGPSKQSIASDSPVAVAGAEVGDGISFPFDLPSIEYLASEFQDMSLNGTDLLLNANGSKCEENTSSSSHSSFDPSDMSRRSATSPESVIGDHQRRQRYQGSSASTYLNGGTSSFLEPRPSVSTPEFEFPSSSWWQQHHHHHRHQLNALSPGYVPYSQQPQLDGQSWLLEYEKFYRNYSQLHQNQSLGRHVIGRENPGLQLKSHMTFPQQQQARQVNPFNYDGNINSGRPMRKQGYNLRRGFNENSGQSKRNIFIERPVSIDSIIQKLDNLQVGSNGFIFNEENRKFVDQVFTIVIGDVFALMTNSSGYHLVEKLVQICRQEQLTLVVQEISKNSSQLFRLACDPLGTHVVRRIIETVRTSLQHHLISSSLKHYLLPLIEDKDGVLVVELCIQCLPPPYRESFLGPAVNHCVELARGKLGCCFLQKYIGVLDGSQKIKLISMIASKACELSQDPYGNYLVQCILERDIPWAIGSILNQLQGHYRALSLQKHGSNVVEKCMVVAGADGKSKIIKELVADLCLPEIAQDKYGNYVIQAAFAACEEDGALRAAFSKAINPHIPQLRSSTYGKKVLQCIKRSRK